jgi:photosystem II stability/assembly factor-like uncharacterized protein
MRPHREIPRWEGSPGSSRPGAIRIRGLERRRSVRIAELVMNDVSFTSLPFPFPRRGALFATCLAAAIFHASPSIKAADDWTDISTPLLDQLTKGGTTKTEWPGGCSGVVVNRTNGDVTIKVVGLGLWRSSDQGKNWKQIDEKTVSGRDETGWATNVDQNTPTRMASFSLDGSAGWTTDGTKWNKFTTLGRNWDFGSVDWSAPVPQTIIAAKHETNPPGEVYITSDGGVTWKQLSIHLGGRPERLSMAGALGATTFIYSNGDGIHRSTDAGATWTKVSAVTPQTRIPVLFHGAYYLGSANGLLISKDLGATWQEQGKVNIWLGPFFGHDEKEMVVIGKEGIFLTKDAGATWKKAADLKPAAGKGFAFTPHWFGCYTWDPVNNVLYASAMGNPVFRLRL